jgi:hypothetical protein
LNLDFINSIPKTVNANGCWIPLHNKPESNGYVRIMINDQRYGLHRLSMCIYYKLDYNNSKIESRHSTGCDTACFWYEHVKPGTHSDNVLDSVRDGTHHESSRTVCGSCGNPYTIEITQTGPNRGKARRVCNICRHKDRW